jgi:hypothetical protein
LRSRSTSNRGAPAASIRFPPSNFKHFLTLFSKSFSSFPRGTCSLSVSCQYLALDGIYHPLRTAFPNSPTRRQVLVERRGPGPYGVFTLHDVPFQGTSARRATEGPSPDYNSRRLRRRDFQAGLFPVRSPLLGKSWLVSSPPLSDMLKLSGWSFPIRGLMRDFTRLSPGASRDLEKIWTCFGTRSHLGRPATPHFDEHSVST